MTDETARSEEPVSAAPTVAASRLGLELEYGFSAEALPSDLARRFVRLELGDEGKDYLERAFSTRPGRAKTTLHRVLRTWMSDFDVNGLLDMYPMHLLGTSQWERLLGARARVRHLDVGAGSGDITRTLTPLVAETVTTETSRVMARNLRRSGFRCHETDLARAPVPGGPYDLVTCLNVLDRCERPRSLLANLANALAPDGRLVLATPFPFDPFVYDGPTSRAPSERLDLPRDAWEPSVARLSVRVLEPLGLSVEVVSRVPYICRGDAQKPLYVLDDALLICKKSVHDGAGRAGRQTRSDHPRIQTAGQRTKSVQSG
jgi:SAM-dependent methyltransferase